MELTSVATSAPRHNRLTQALAGLSLFFLLTSYFASAEPSSDVARLINQLHDKSPEVRKEAAYDLSRLGPAAEAAIPDLVKSLSDPEASVRLATASALGQLGPAAKVAIPDLVKLLDDPKAEVRASAAIALGRFGPAAGAVAPNMVKLLKDPESRVRRETAEALGRLGLAAKVAISALVKLLEDPEDYVRLTAARALADIAEKVVDRNEPDVTSRRHLDEAFRYPDSREGYQANPNVMRIRRAANHLKALEDAFFIGRAGEWLLTVSFKDWKTWAVILPAGWFVFLFAVFLMRPLWLPRWNEALKDQLSIKAKHSDVELSLGVPLCYVSLIRLLAYRRRVLNAWVRAHAERCRENFDDLPTVKDRRIHVQSPVKVDGSLVTEFTASTLRHHIGKATHRCRWLIFGEGGVGKTSLACQMARWAMAPNKADRLVEKHVMLPVLIEDELDNPATPEGLARFTEAIRGKLQALIGAPEPISPELLTHLLRHSRILVIVDHFTEMTETTQDQIRFDTADFPAAALVVTSRIDATLGNLPKRQVEPIRIQGKRLSAFLDAYLNERKTRDGWKARDLFDDVEYFEACKQLSRMAGERDITALLAKLYADQMVSAKESQDADKLPETIPDLMLRYLSELNRNVAGEENRLVHHDCKAIAWECLKTNYRPGPAKRTAALESLKDDVDGEQSVEARLDYLINRLRVIQITGSAEDQIRFVLDPLAEYLAGMNVTEKNRGSKTKWRDFLDKAEKKTGAPETIRGFLLAVRDCCLASPEELNIPPFVVEELGKRAGVAEEMARARIAPLIEAFRNQSPEIRQSAVKQLGEKGRVAVPTICDALRDEDAEVRQEAARSLMRIVTLGHHSDVTVRTLIDALGDSDQDVRWMAANSLGIIGTPALNAKAVLLKTLEEDVEWRPRQIAALALPRIGGGPEIVPALVEAMKDRDKNVASAAASALGELGTAANKAVPDLIEAHSDSHSGLSGNAARALGKIGLATRDVLEVLTSRLTGDGAAPSIPECSALGDLGPAAEPAVPALIGALGNVDLCKAVTEALGKIGRPVAVVVPALMNLLTNSDPSVRRRAAEGLGKIGPDAKDAIESLINVSTTDDDGSVRVDAANSLVMMGCDPGFSVSILCDCLEDRDGSARKAAAANLGKPGFVDVNSVPALAAALKDTEWSVREAAAMSLGNMGPLAATAVPDLVAAFQDDWQPTQKWLGEATWGEGPLYDGIRYWSAVALGRIGPSACAAIPTLKDTFNLQEALRQAARDAIILIEHSP
jgi:HEAT repeat protein